MDNVFFFISVGLIAGLPLNHIFLWFYNKTREMAAKLDKPQAKYYVSKAPYIAFLGAASAILKGVLVMALSDFMIVTDYMMIGAIAVLLILDYWNPLLKFNSNQQSSLIITGIYAYMHPALLMIYPLCFLASLMLLNAIKPGYILAIILMWPVIWLFQLPSIYLILNSVIFVVILIANAGLILDHYEHQPYTLLMAFKNRNKY